jgi:hypothetical protein
VGVIDELFVKTKYGPTITPEQRQRMDKFLQRIQQEIQQATSLGVKDRIWI